MKRWVVSQINKEKVSEMSAKFNFSPFLAMLLQVRGCCKDEEVKDFFSREETLSDPMSFMDMDKAVSRVKQAIEKFELICVYGDYDADGVTATALLYSYLYSRGANVTFFIPDRELGYGLNKPDIKKLCDMGVQLIVTVDNGVSAVAEVDYARSLNIDVVVTDHHKAPDDLPKAVAVVDPHRKGCLSLFKDYAGVGVAFKLVCAMEHGVISANDLLREYADLVAIGTIGDIVPITGENRIFAKVGLRMITRNKRCGIQALLGCSGLAEREVTSSNVLFALVPRINAVGRISLAEKAVKMLIGESREEVESYAAFLDEQNSKRKSIEADIVRRVNESLMSKPELLLDDVLVVQGEDFHPGVIGIVASRIVDAYGKPCIIISTKGDMARGSGRGVEGFSIYDAAKCWFDENTTGGFMNEKSAQGERVPVKFGGHTMALGFDIPCDSIESFRCSINAYAQKHQGIPMQALQIDCKLKPQAVSYDLVEDLERMEPFGCGNQVPVFGLYNMVIDKITPVSGGKHARLLLSRDNVKLTAMRFSINQQDFEYKEGDVVDIAATFHKNIYFGERELSVFIRDIHFSNVSYDAIIKGTHLYERIKRKDKLDVLTIKPVIPTRDDFARVYRALHKEGGWKSTFEHMVYRLELGDIDPCKLRLIVDVMAELGIVKVNVNATKYAVSMQPSIEKVSLDSSCILCNLNMYGRDTM